MHGEECNEDGEIVYLLTFGSNRYRSKFLLDLQVSANFNCDTYVGEEFV